MQSPTLLIKAREMSLFDTGTALISRSKGYNTSGKHDENVLEYTSPEQRQEFIDEWKEIYE